MIYLTTITFQKMITSFQNQSSNPGMIYGLYKVHKYNSFTNHIPPFRPILSGIGIGKYNLEKLFVPTLKEFTVDEYTVCASISFCKETKSQDSSLFMDSFDIQSLFTNTPLHKTKNICFDRLCQNKRKVKRIFKTKC